MSTDASGRVLVTGATGFIGRQTLTPLTERGFEVHAVSSRPAKGSAGEYTWHRADLLEASDRARLIEETRASHLLHLAWTVEHGKFWTAPENRDWVEASLDLVERFVAAGGQRAALAGTCAEYDWGHALLEEATTPIAPATLYGQAKDDLRRRAEKLSSTGGLSLAWGRVFFIYGPHEHPNRLVSSVIRALLAGEPALCSHGEQIRDFLDVRDLGGAFAALLASQVEGPVNLASGDPRPIKEVVLEIARQLARRDLVRLGAREAPTGDPPALEAAVERLRTEVGWHPAHSLEEGLAHAIQFWRQRSQA